MNRRSFLSSSVAAMLSSAVPAPAAGQRLPIRKAVLFSMLPRTLSVAERFQLAADCGFQEIECGTTPEQAKAEEILDASRKSKVRIHSVMNADHWRYPLSSSDPEVVAKCMAGMETSLHNAKLWGADTVLLVPAVVNPETRYQEAWERSQRQIRKLIPLAQELKVIIAVEEVWNKFLLSPLEFARYVDDFNSPYLKAYFDVGNVVLTGYPQDWIRTLGNRIAKLHLKDFTFKKRQAEFVNLRDGEIDWKGVHAALAAIGYHGSATVELNGGDAAYLQDVSKRVDLILEGV
jgi:L-ribulose-5-phosphate 3-epimerase